MDFAGFEIRTDVFGWAVVALLLVGMEVLAPGAFMLWLAFAAEPRGRLHVDDGASIALRRGKASLLAAGITRVEGTFAEGEPVEIVGADGEPLGRGFVGYSSAELAAEAGHSSAEEGHEEQRPAVHRDQMMLAD